jgi:hypothetical protein
MTDLATITSELESHVATDGWDQPPRLYALVRTGSLLATEPHLAGTLAGADPDSLTPVEQEPIEGDLLDLLPQIGWPEGVAGAAIVNEVFMLPSGAETEIPEGVVAEEWAAAHPERREVRIALAVVRDGTETATLRVRGRDGADDEVVTSPGLLPNLSAALLETFAEPAPDEPAPDAPAP